MSSAVYPVLPGLGFSVKKTPQFKSRVMQSVSGKEVRLADWNMPRYTYELVYDVLREHGSFQELKSLQGFWLARQGSFDTFLFDDPDDNTIIGQYVGTTDGVTAVYSLVRTYGGAWTDFILAPHIVSHVYLDGVATVGTFSISFWGDDNPGLLTFSSPPTTGQVITIDFSYYWPCRFVDDTQDFEKFMDKLWEAKSVKFISVK